MQALKFQLNPVWQFALITQPIVAESTSMVAYFFLLQSSSIANSIPRPRKGQTIHLSSRKHCDE